MKPELKEKTVTAKKPISDWLEDDEDAFMEEKEEIVEETTQEEPKAEETTTLETGTGTIEDFSGESEIDSILKSLSQEKTKKKKEQKEKVERFVKTQNSNRDEKKTELIEKQKEFLMGVFKNIIAKTVKIVGAEPFPSVKAHMADKKLLKLDYKVSDIQDKELRESINGRIWSSQKERVYQKDTDNLILVVDVKRGMDYHSKMHNGMM